MVARDPFQRDDDAVGLLYQRAELHELAAERFFVLGDGSKGERERGIAMEYWHAARRLQGFEPGGFAPRDDGAAGGSPTDGRGRRS